MAGRKNGEEGYVLGWVVVMVMILMILVTAILFATSAYYRQSLREYNDRQAYLTARSIVQTAAADFTGNGSGELRDAILDEISEFMDGGSDAELGDEPNEESGAELEDEPDGEFRAEPRNESNGAFGTEPKAKLNAQSNTDSANKSDFKINTETGTPAASKRQRQRFRHHQHDSHLRHQVPIRCHHGKLYDDRILHAGRELSYVDRCCEERQQHRDHDSLSPERSGIGGRAMDRPRV